MGKPAQKRYINVPCLIRFPGKDGVRQKKVPGICWSVEDGGMIFDTASRIPVGTIVHVIPQPESRDNPPLMSCKVKWVQDNPVRPGRFLIAINVQWLAGLEEHEMEEVLGGLELEANSMMLGSILMRMPTNELTTLDLKEAMERQFREPEHPIGMLLVEMGKVTDEEVAEAMRQQEFYLSLLRQRGVFAEADEPADAGE
jgi:hypothetical protein